MSRRARRNSSELNALLVAAFHAYRQGLRRQPQPDQQVQPRGFDSLKLLGTVGWLPLSQRLLLHKLHGACAKGLFATRDGRFDDARINYEKAGERLDLLKGKERLGWLLGVSTYEAGVAYLDFRMGCVEQARERLDLAMDADLELEHAGLPVMQMHRIQQGHNLARMELRLGRREAALRLAGVLAAYLEGLVGVLPFHHGWGAKSLRAVPRSLRQAMIHQIVAETAGHIVTGDAAEEEWRGLIEASRPGRTPETAISPQVQYALRAQADRLANNPEGYLFNLERFFRLSIRRCHLLWYPILVELVGFCLEMDTHHSRQLRDVILRDSAKWQGCPSFLRDCLYSPPSTQRTVA